MYKMTMTDAEVQALTTILDAAARQLGLQGARMVVLFQGKMEEAIRLSARESAMPEQISAAPAPTRNAGAVVAASMRDAAEKNGLLGA